MAGGTPVDYDAIYDDDRKREILHDRHFGLNIYKEDVKIGLTMKSVDYIQFGLPLLNSISGDTKALIRRYDGFGINVHKEGIDK